MKALLKKVFLILTLFWSVNIFAQTDPQGELDYLYVVCDTPRYAGAGESEVCFQLHLVTDNTGGNRISALGDALLISGDNLVAADTSVVKAFSQTAIESWFVVATYKFDDPDPTVAPFHMHYGGFNITQGLPAGDHLIARMCFTINDTGTICIDTLSSQTLHNELVTELATSFIAGWGGPSGQGYPQGVGVCCQVGLCAAIPGDANANGSLALSDIISIVNFVFCGGSLSDGAGLAASILKCSQWPPCPSNSSLCWLSGLRCRGDWNGSGSVSLADVIYGINYIFNRPGGPWVPIPFGVCCRPIP